MATTPLTLRLRVRELEELGLKGAAFRLLWEVKRRARIFEALDRRPRRDRATLKALEAAPASWRSRLWFAAPETVRDALGARVDAAVVEDLVAAAQRATTGRILSFSHETRDCGHPIAWHRDPVTGQPLDPRAHWARAMSTVRGDIKDLWEMGRFPHAYLMARAACFRPDERAKLATALRDQIDAFIVDNPFAKGIHWVSGQEIAFRIFAWTFALPSLLLELRDDAFLARVAEHLYDCAIHVARHIDYARLSTYNNHLLSEAACLMLSGHLLPGVPHMRDIGDLGRALFDEGVRRQFYPDGGYIQQAHNYHRVALQDLLWAASVSRAAGEPLPGAWTDAAMRSVDFLTAQQAPSGALPNYGNNDGALVSPLSTCSYDDFRPTLQAVSVMFGGVRRFEEGAWDEEALWFTGPLPTRPPPPLRESPESRSFPVSGHHVLRGRSAGTFAFFRCGSLLDRFTQMDMLHVDIHWRGVNVVVDPGTYRYNGAPRWHEHFTGTASHNTLTVDGEDQMVPIRQFKALYPTKAKLLASTSGEGFELLAGEHYGYRRLRGEVTHRRAVLFDEDELWVVVDTVQGAGRHRVRLHWTLGDFPRRAPAVCETDVGSFEVAVFAEDGQRLQLDVAVGDTDPPRGWLSRRYGHKVPVPSVVVESRGELPAQLVTVLGAAPVNAVRQGNRWRVEAARGTLGFSLRDGIPCAVEVQARGERAPHQ